MTRREENSPEEAEPKCFLYNAFNVLCKALWFASLLEYAVQIKTFITWNNCFVSPSEILFSLIYEWTKVQQAFKKRDDDLIA